MDLRPLGRTGVRVSSLCFGTMSFGTTADEEESRRLYAAARDAGIDFFDTADIYGKGRSEEILGRLMADERDALVVASKVYGRTGPGPNDLGLSRRHVTRAVEDSLRRLGTDRLDVYYVHMFDAHTPIEETVRALDHLVREGRILYPAVSNWAAWQIATALGVSYREALARFEVVQPMYNLVKRQVEVEILPLARAEGLAVAPYSPLGGGLLTGKYAGDATPDRGRLVEVERYATRYGHASYPAIVDGFLQIAQRENVHPATLAVAWAGAHPDVTAPIVGARDVEQLAPSLAAATFTMSDELRDELTALTPEIAPAHDRREEAIR